MRNELSIDVWNLPKWSTVLNVADNVGAAIIVYAAMEVADIGRHGHRRENWPSARADVARFFDQERTKVDGGESMDIWRIETLDLRIRAFRSRYSYASRINYVEGLCHLINGEQTSAPMVVLFDPCNGIADGGAKKKRICAWVPSNFRRLGKSFAQKTYSLYFNGPIAQTSHTAAVPLVDRGNFGFCTYLHS